MTKIQVESAVSVPAQLASILAQEVERGVYGASGRLPSERALAERFGISRTSVRESLSILVKDGVLKRVVGKGTYVGSAVPPSVSETATGQLAFLIGENIFQFVQPGYSRVLVGAEQYCRQEGFRLLFHSVGEEETDPQFGFGEDSQPGDIQGCLVAGGLRKKTLDRLFEWEVPIVLTDLVVQDGNTSAVVADYASGTKQAVEHLAELGHQEIGFVGFPNSEKYRAYWQTLGALSLRYDPRFVQFLQLSEVEPGIVVGFRAIQEMQSSGTLPTAVICTNDLVAMGLLEALKMSGISVPRDVSVIGCDDLGRDFSPPLTTIRSFPEEVGRIAAKMLIDQLAGNTTASQIAVPTELIVRGTTAPPNPHRRGESHR